MNRDILSHIMGGNEVLSTDNWVDPSQKIIHGFPLSAQVDWSDEYPGLPVGSVPPHHNQKPHVVAHSAKEGPLSGYGVWFTPDLRAG